MGQGYLADRLFVIKFWFLQIDPADSPTTSPQHSAAS
jgi:hypothetical protein